MVRTFLVVCASLVLGISGAWSQTGEYRTAVRQLLEKSGTIDALTEGRVEMIIDSLKEEYPEAEASFWLNQAKVAEGSAVDEITEYLVPVYAEYFTLEELNALIEFYETPEGRKWAAVHADLAGGHGNAQARWCRALADRISAELKRLGH